MKLSKYPDVILLTECANIILFDNTLRNISHEMKLFIHNELNWGNPAGLAAPQVGLNMKLCIAQGKVYINPKIINKSKEIYVSKEGCFSLEKDKYYNIERYKWVIVEYQRLNGKITKEKFIGLSAIVLQHEIDHLYGKLLIKEQQ